MAKKGREGQRRKDSKERMTRKGREGRIARKRREGRREKDSEERAARKGWPRKEGKEMKGRK